MINSQIKHHVPELKKLFVSNKVESAYFFGSVCTDSFTEKSDVDIVISFLNGIDPVEQGDLWWKIYFSLEDMLKRPVDLVMERSIVNPYLKKEIEKNREYII